MDVRAEVGSLAHDEGVAPYVSSFQVAIHTHGASEVQFAHEPGAFPQEASDLAEVAPFRMPPILLSSFLRHR